MTMPFRTDLPDLVISLGNFQDFDHRRDVEESLFDNRWTSLQEGDVIPWECGQFDGLAMVVGRQGDILVVRKLA